MKQIPSAKDQIVLIDNEPTRILIKQILAAVSQYEKTSIVLRLKTSRQCIKQKTGRCEGRKPYGFYPGEDKIIQRIKELYRKPHGDKRLGFGTIARKLNEEGIKTRTGVPWSDTQVKSIINNIQK